MEQVSVKTRRCRQCGKDLDVLGLHERALYCSIVCSDKAKRTRKKLRYNQLARRAGRLSAA